MARESKKAKKRVNPFDVIIVLLVLCLLATFGFRIYNGVATKNDSNVSDYILTFECNGKVNSLGEYLDAGTPVYLSANKEILGYIYEGKDAVKVTVLTEAETEAATEFVTSADVESEIDTTEAETEKPLEYKKADIEGKIRLSANVNVYSGGVYYSIGDINFAPGSVLKIYTEEATFTVTVKSIAKAN